MSESSLAEVQALLEGSSYRIIGPLGEGAMGAVYRAEQVRIKRPVVVKIMHPHVGAEQSDRLRLEAQALAKMRHDNVVEVLDYGTTTDQRPYLVMEYLEGQGLDEVLEQRGTLPVEEALDLTRQALAGLHVVHEEELVHRDLKPANLFLCKSGRLKLLDFGLIKLLEGATGIDPLQMPTQTGSAIGTPRYMAPEQASGKPVDRRTDLYAVGVMLYRMLTGRTPFDHHDDLTALLLAHVKEPPEPPSKLAPQPLPAGVDEVILRALAKTKEERHATALEMAAELYSLGQAYDALHAELGLEQVSPEGDFHQVHLDVGSSGGAAVGPEGPASGAVPSPGPTEAADHAGRAGGAVPAPGPTGAAAADGAPTAGGSADLGSTVALDDWEAAEAARAGVSPDLAAAAAGPVASPAAGAAAPPPAAGAPAQYPGVGHGGSGAAAVGASPAGAAAVGAATVVGPPRPQAGGLGAAGGAAAGQPAGGLGAAWSDPVGRKVFWACAAGAAVVSALVGWLV